ncbi:hypothetical protein [Yersinia sp. 2466 StPb PI]|uniref:hypothetical protein n=1 Tax=Yersinia sp. 2466 StPb PI TaxID=3061648 RepID=UPI00355C1F24
MIDLPITDKFKGHLKQVTKEIFTKYLSDKGVSLQCVQYGKEDPVVSYVPEVDEEIITVGMVPRRATSERYIYL